MIVVLPTTLKKKNSCYRTSASTAPPARDPMASCLASPSLPHLPPQCTSTRQTHSCLRAFASAVPAAWNTVPCMHEAGSMTERTLPTSCPSIVRLCFSSQLSSEKSTNLGYVFTHSFLSLPRSFVMFTATSLVLAQCQACSRCLKIVCQTTVCWNTALFGRHVPMGREHLPCARLF